MNLTPFEASKLVDWAEHVLTNGRAPRNMPRGIREVDQWAFETTTGLTRPFPKFDTEQPYTWEG